VPLSFFCFICRTSHLLHLFKDALISSPSSTTLRDECFSHAAEAVGVDHTEFLVGVTTHTQSWNI